MKVGILGAGQLGQMLAQAGHPIGIDVECLGTAGDPASRGGTIVESDLSDVDAIRIWARSLDVLTYESENTPAELVADLSEYCSMLPPVRALITAQDRWHEKRLFHSLDVPVAPFRLCSDAGELKRAHNELGAMVVKTRRGGYDGKGQAVVQADGSLDPAIELLQSGDLVAEQWVDFDSEASLIAVRNSSGEIRFYPLTANEHRNGILHISRAGEPVDSELVEMAQGFVTAIATELSYGGVLTLELFVKGGRLYANEMAPRVHNSGHWTIEAAETSQFENHLRAICGLPLGDTSQRLPAAMVNLVGTLPDRNELLQLAGGNLHLYGKAPRTGRKLGHVTITASSPTKLLERVDAALALID